MAATNKQSKKKVVLLPSFKAGNEVLLNSNINRKELRSEWRNLRGSGLGGKTHKLSA